MGKKNKPPKRGYFVSRQLYALGEPCVRAVEVAYSNDHHEPFEHSGPDMLIVAFASAGEDRTFRYPRDAVAAAIRVREAWLKHQPEAAEDGVRLTATTGGGMFLADLFEDDAP